MGDYMTDLFTIGGVILVFFILISPIIAIILEEVFYNKQRNKKPE